MIAPLLNYGIKGAIWYQGESNAGRPADYKDLMQTLIEDWRSKWSQGNFPFTMCNWQILWKQKPHRRKQLGCTSPATIEYTECG